MPLVLLPSDDNIARAAEALRAGHLVGMPTETVYGLAGDATNPHAVAKIYATKSRPQNNPLIIHVPDTEAAMQHGDFNSAARVLASVFWPGPMTLVVSRPADQQTIAIRVPAHPVAQKLLRAFGGPIAAPSANLSGQLSPTQADHVARAFAEMDEPTIILAGGRAEAGLESTIVDCTADAPRILRPGSITFEQLAAAVPDTLPYAPQTTEPAAPNAPGQLLRHYAPRTKLRLNVAEIFDDEVLLAFGPEPLWARRAVRVLNLSPDADLTEAAHNLFSYLHQLDGLDAKAIAVMPIPNTGAGVAINDRLRRGAI
jgi:L-threonylcarbamoyladenylate synthase